MFFQMTFRVKPGLRGELGPWCLLAAGGKGGLLLHEFRASGLEQP